MKIHVGSKNKAKLAAVEEILDEYEFLKGSSVTGIEVSSGVADQPMSIEETFQGAVNRAKAAHEGADLGIGLEAGLFKVSVAETGHVKYDVCAIYDGEHVYLGSSSGYEVPKEILDLVNQGFTQQEAAFKSGHTIDPKLGSAGGTVSVLTKERVTRKDLIKQALRLALIHLEK